ncbi:MAG TPA: TOBE domain-containing protein, partial [Nocardioides sp.]|nr:TOBE domain-containing protein [Nocardioides sp.]
MIRPEKVLMQAEAEAPDACNGMCVAPGVVREVVYLGASTHSVVGLDAGATLTVAASPARAEPRFRSAVVRGEVGQGMHLPGRQGLVELIRRQG